MSSTSCAIIINTILRIRIIERRLSPILFWIYLTIIIDENNNTKLYEYITMCNVYGSIRSNCHTKNEYFMPFSLNISVISYVSNQV